MRYLQTSYRQAPTAMNGKAQALLNLRFLGIATQRWAYTHLWSFFENLHNIITSKAHGLCLCFGKSALNREGLDNLNVEVLGKSPAMVVNAREVNIGYVLDTACGRHFLEMTNT